MYRETKDRLWADKAVFAAQQGHGSTARCSKCASHRARRTWRRVSTGGDRRVQRALELAPNSDEVYRRLAAAYGRLGQNEQSVRMHLKAIEKNPDHWLNHNALGGTYFRIGDYPKAVDEFRKVIAIEPDNVNGYNDLGAAYLQTAATPRPPTPSSTRWRCCRRRIPGAISASRTLAGPLKDALPASQKAVELSPSSDAWLSNLADGYRWVGERKKAADTYEKAISLAYQALTVDPNDATTRCNLGTYYAKNGDTVQGLKFIEEALATDRSNPGFAYNAAVAHALAGHTDQALQALRAAFKAGYPAAFSKNDPDLKSLSEDQRFRDMTRN